MQKIITVDYSSFLSCLYPVLIWGVYITLIALGVIKTNIFSLPIIFGVITIVALFILIWRIQVFRAIFNDGVETTATINFVVFFRGTGRVEYTYTYQGQKYENSNAVIMDEQTLVLKVGEQIILIVDRNNPNRAVIRDLYM